MNTIKLLFVPLALVAAPAHASETITYSYDALGRVVAVAHTGTVNNGLNAAYSYDPAGNRTAKTVIGSLAAAAPAPHTRSANLVSPAKPPAARR